MQDRNFDDIAEKFSRNIYGTTKGQLRQAILWQDLQPLLDRLGPGPLRVLDAGGGEGQTAIKVASGAAESVPYITVTNLARTLRELKERDIWVVGTDAEGKDDLYSAQWPAATAWVLGAEGDGLRRLTRETCDQLVTIPMLGSVQSLNVSVATGVCLYEARRRRS